jgi:hypothetical protein
MSNTAKKYKASVVHHLMLRLNWVGEKMNPGLDATDEDVLQSLTAGIL